MRLGTDQVGKRVDLIPCGFVVFMHGSVFHFNIEDDRRMFSGWTNLLFGGMTAQIKDSKNTLLLVTTWGGTI